MRKKNYSFELTPEENLAHEIWLSINQFQATYKGYSSLELNKEILTDLHFEIVNDFYERNVLISYVVKPDTNITEIELHLMFIGISKIFVDKSNPNRKRYLTVWV